MAVPACLCTLGLRCLPLCLQCAVTAVETLPTSLTALPYQKPSLLLQVVMLAARGNMTVLQR